jgi:hypothetical protein
MSSRSHPRGRGPQSRLGRVRLHFGQGLVDQAQVAVDPPDGLSDLPVTGVDPLKLAHMVAEQGLAELYRADVAGGRQLLDLDVQQRRLALGVDQEAGHV